MFWYSHFMPGIPTKFALTTETTSGNTGSLEVGSESNDRYDDIAWSKLAILVAILATGGTSETMDLTVEWSSDGTTFYTSDPVDSFTQITAAGTAVKIFDVKGLYYRVSWALGGTAPSFSFLLGEYVS